jgi:hypothetical protein
MFIYAWWHRAKERGKPDNVDNIYIYIYISIYVSLCRVKEGGKPDNFDILCMRACVRAQDGVLHVKRPTSACVH